LVSGIISSSRKSISTIEYAPVFVPFGRPRFYFFSANFCKVQNLAGWLDLGVRIRFWLVLSFFP